MFGKGLGETTQEAARSCPMRPLISPSRHGRRRRLGGHSVVVRSVRLIVVADIVPGGRIGETIRTHTCIRLRLAYSRTFLRNTGMNSALAR